jgi:hypothetical protein
MMRARVIAPLVAAVLGISGGIATALVVPGEDDDSPRASSYNDPLHLDIPQVDQDCTGESLLVVAYGDTAAPLGSAASGFRSKGARYLRSDSSCPTALGPERRPTPKYVVYLGPYDTRREPCELRMAGDAGGNYFVTVLSSQEGEDEKELVKCPCELPRDAGPVLSVGMVKTQESVIWTRSLQSMLNDDDPAAFPRSAINGEYDEATAARVADYQEAAPGKLTTPGLVDTTTWGILTDRICRGYHYMP